MDFREPLPGNPGCAASYDGLSIDPCIPEGFGDFTLTRRFRGATYYFDVKNPNNVEKGVAYLEVDGKHVNEMWYLLRTERQSIM